MSVFTIACDNGHRAVNIATIADTGLGWDVAPEECDMTRRRHPVDGYRFWCPLCLQYASAHRGDLIRALTRAKQESCIDRISLRGLRYLRRLAHDPVRPPQDFDLLAALNPERSV